MDEWESAGPHGENDWAPDDSLSWRMTEEPYSRTEQTITISFLTYWMKSPGEKTIVHDFSLIYYLRMSEVFCFLMEIFFKDENLD